MNFITAKTSKLVGVLFLVAMVSSLIGGDMIHSIISSNNLITVSDHRIKLLIGVILELTNAIAVLGIGTRMYPILRKYSESIAIRYLSFRIIEAVLCSMIIIAPLSLIQLSKEYVKKDIFYPDILQSAVSLSIDDRSAIYNLLMPIFFSLGALLFYYLLHRMKLIPRIISVWGTVGALLIIIMNMQLQIQGDSMNKTLQVVMALPMILNEIFLGFWLIIKGFNPAHTVRVNDGNI